MKSLAEEIIQGRRLSRQDDLSFFETANLSDLCEGADEIRRALCGQRADLCTIINARSGRCSENCKFCAQSAANNTDCQSYPFLETDSILKECGSACFAGVDRFSIVTAGRTLTGTDLEAAVKAYTSMHHKYPDMKLCASHGLMSQRDLERLKEAGVTTYHCNLETSERFFPKICTSHTYADKLETIRRAKAAGLTVCSGGILGMGEGFQDRILLAMQLAELNISSIPINFLIPVPQTPLAELPPLSRSEILRTAALFRYINPAAFVRIAAGRTYFPDGGQELFQAGTNAAITGDMLTTAGSSTFHDRLMLIQLGFQLKSVKENNIHA